QQCPTNSRRLKMTNLLLVLEGLLLGSVWSKETCPRFRPDLPGIELRSLACKASALTTELQDSTNPMPNCSRLVFLFLVTLTLGLIFVLFFIGSYSISESCLSPVWHPKYTQSKYKTTRVRSICKVNTSVLQLPDFSKEPAQLQNFMKYRHCREFELLHNLPDKCKEDVFLLLVVKSNPFNYDRREMVRKTWGKERETPDVQEQGKANQLLEIESKEHQDILQWDFLDSFFNLTLKQYLFLQWMDNYCPSAQFIFNGDDDVFANTDNMVEFLLFSASAQKHLYVGYLFEGNKLVRDKRSKYYIPLILSTSNIYAPYIGGGGILMSSYSANAIYNASQTLQLFPIDDAFLGMCLEKAGLSPKSHDGFRTLGINDLLRKGKTEQPCILRKLMLVHRYLPLELLLMWDAVNNPNLKCGHQPHP
uniref:Hexosyltransferase n=1 Tax=Callorhinchus milii TaxID=7868 RepID=A0A4W3GXF6_CALMI